MMKLGRIFGQETSRFFQRIAWVSVLFSALLVTTACGGGDDEGDTTRPTVISTVPANGAVDVLLDTTITITFSEDIDQGTLWEAIFISGVGEGAFTWVLDGAVLTVTPDQAFQKNSTYSVNILGEVADFERNTMSSNHEFSFTTGDVASQVSDVGPPENIDVQIKGTTAFITFDYVNDASHIMAYMTPSGGDEVEFALSVNGGQVPSLLPGTTYDFQFAAFDRSSLEGARSEVITRSVLSQPPTPTLTALGCDVDVAWAAESDKKYNIYCDEGTLSENEIFNQATNIAQVVLDVSTSPQTVAMGYGCNWKVICAVVEAGEGTLSTPSTLTEVVTFKDATTTPTLVVGADGPDVTIEVQWYANSYATSYQVNYTNTATSITGPDDGVVLPAVPATACDTSPCSYTHTLSEFFETNGSPLGHFYAVFPTWEDGAGNSSRAAVVGVRNIYINAGNDLPWLTARCEDTFNGDSRRFFDNGVGTLYWLNTKDTVQWYKQTDQSTGTISLTLETRSFDVDVAGGGDIYYVDYAGKQIKRCVPSGTTCSSNTDLLATPTAARPEEIIVAGVYIWFTHMDNLYYIKTNLTGQTETKLVSDATGIRSLRLVGSTLYYGSDTGIHKITGANDGPSAVASDITLDHAARSIAIQGDNLYFIEPQTSGGFARAELRVLSLTTPTNVTLLHEGLFDSNQLSVLPGTPDILFWASGTTVWEIFKKEALAGSSALRVGMGGGTNCYHVQEDAVLMRGSSTIISAYPHNMLWQMSAPTEGISPVAAKGAYAGEIAITVDITSSVHTHYLVTQSAPTDLYIGSNPRYTSVYTLTGLDNTTSYQYEVCPENLAGKGPCVTTDAVTPD
ncbi:Ig-like domain-containing protein [Myxococcota bacterium]|nr:Ig-like domain-containing protein [Myxococcota bacterium]